MANYSHRKDIISIYIHYLQEIHINEEFHPGRECVKQNQASFSNLSLEFLSPLEKKADKPASGLISIL